MLLYGQDARTDAIADGLRRSPTPCALAIYAQLRNPGLIEPDRFLSGSLTDLTRMVAAAGELAPDLVVIGPLDFANRLAAVLNGTKGCRAMVRVLAGNVDVMVDSVCEGRVTFAACVNVYPGPNGEARPRVHGPWTSKTGEVVAALLRTVGASS